MTLVDRSDEDTTMPVRYRLAAKSPAAAKHFQDVTPTPAVSEAAPASISDAALNQVSTDDRDDGHAGIDREADGESESLEDVEASGPFDPRSRVDPRSDGEPRRAKVGETDLFTSLSGRPPVAVGATPVAFERADTEGVISIVRPTIEPRNRVAGGLSPTPSVPSPPRRMTRSETRLMMEKGEVRSLTLDRSVRRFHVDETDTCQVLRSGGNRLKLIGTGRGVTRLVVWVSEDGNDATSKPAMVFQVEVKETLDATGNDIADLTERLNDSIRLVFPSSDVRVDRRGERLVVRGGCADEETATGILRMVRRSCLMPVQDAITIR